MFSANLLKPRNQIPLKSFALPLTSISFPCLPNQPQNYQPGQDQDQQDQRVSINYRQYWTRKIHNLCFKHRKVDEALRLLDRLRFLWYRPDSLNLSSIIHALADANRFDEAHHFLLISISNDCVPDERTCNVLIARLLDGKTPSATSRVVYSLLAAKPEFVPSLVNYNRLIDQFCEVSQRPDVGHRLLFDMMSRGHSPNVVTLTTLIGGYGDFGSLRDAYKLFDEMREYGLVPNSLTYSSLIRGVLKRRDLEHTKEMMKELWETMKHERNQSVNSAAFANLVDSLSRQGYFNEVFEIADEMPQGNNVHEEFAYAHMIDSLCRMGRFHGASRVVYIMRRKGFSPSLVSYNSVVHGLCKEAGCMRAYQLFEEGIGFGYFPSKHTYKVLVEALCQVRELDKAREVLRYMLSKKGSDRTILYNIYLRALGFMDNPTEMLTVLVWMLQDECQPDVITLNTVINGFCKMGRVEEALKVLDDMMMGKFCSPDVVTCTTIMTGLLDVGRSREALNILHQLMPSEGIQPGVVSYNAVLRGLLKHALVNEAMGVFKKMIIEGVSADSTTYSVIIEGLCNCNQIDEAKKFWDNIVWPSNIHGDFVYAAILKGLCGSGNFNEACHFLYELVDYGVTPNTVCYNIVIDSACNLGMKREAYQIVREMRNNGVSTDAVTWRTLDKIRIK